MEKQFTVGNIFSRSFDIFGKYFPFMLAIGFLTALPTVLIEAYPEHTGLVLLVPLVNMVLTMVLQGVVVYGVFQHLTGQRISVDASVAVAFRRLGWLLLLAVVTGLAVGLAFLMLIVPGIIVAIMLWVAVPVTVVEKGGVAHAMQRSAELTKGNRGAILGINVIMWILAFVAGVLQFVLNQAMTSLGVVPATLGASLAHWPVVTLTTGLATALSSVVVTVGYYALRNEVDGVATEDLASVFD